MDIVDVELCIYGGIGSIIIYSIKIGPQSSLPQTCRAVLKAAIRVSWCSVPAVSRTVFLLATIIACNTRSLHQFSGMVGHNTEFTYRETVVVLLSVLVVKNSCH